MSEQRRAEERRLNLSTELHDVRDALDRLAVAVATTFDEDRLREAISTDQRRDARQQRSRWSVALLVVMVITEATFHPSRSNHGVTSRIEDCTIVGGKCYADLARNGQAGVVRLVDFEICVALIRPEVRTRAGLEECKAKALVTVTTTTR
jgi:hypothetical protein